MRALGMVVPRKPGPDMTQRDRARSGHFVRPRRGHHVSAGPEELRQHPHHGLEHGGVPPGRLPLGDAGQDALAEPLHRHPRRPALHAHLGDGQHLRPAARRQRHRLPRRRHQLRPGPARADLREGATAEPHRRASSSSTITSSTTPTPRRSSPRSSRTPRRPGRPLRRLRPGEAQLRQQEMALRVGTGRQARNSPASRARASRSRSRPRSASWSGRRRSRTRPCSTSAASARSSSRHFQRYTPELVEDVCGTPRDDFLKVADALLANAGPDRTGAICYARRLDAAHHRRADDPRGGHASAPARQHRPARRRHPGPARPRHHPGLDRHRHALQPPPRLPERAQRPAAARHAAATTSRPRRRATSYWSNFPKFIVSQLKAWYGDAATAENDFAYDFLPKIIGDHSHMPMFVEMHDGQHQGLLGHGPEPGRRRPERLFQRQALAKLDWLVVRDLYETETATFWKDSPEVHERQAQAAGHPDRGVLPAGGRGRRDATAASPTPSGWCSGTRRPPIRPTMPAPTSGSPTTWAGGSRSCTPTARRSATGRSRR